MKCRKIHFSGHATIQMFKRTIDVDQVEHVLKTGKIIREYPEDKPYPSFLILGYVGKRPLHVVVSTDKQGNCYIITAYEPDRKLWKSDFETRK